jgi:hypothetical protein
MSFRERDKNERNTRKEKIEWRDNRERGLKGEVII